MTSGLWAIPLFFTMTVPPGPPPTRRRDSSYGASGADLAHYVRQDQQHRTVPIIILSAIDHEKLQAQTAMACDMYLQKPVAAEVLLYAVASCLENARRRGTISPIEIIVT